jgi:purine-nucleoside phosphorylase
MAGKSKHNRSEADKAAKYLRKGISGSPRAAILTGTGLGDVTASLRIESTLDYQQIPHFPVSTVVSHPGRFLSGTLAGQSVVVLQGRCHLYEGYSPQAVIFPIRVLQALGVTTLILTNAAGGLNPEFSTGQIMIIDDHINLTGTNPLAGPNDDKWGPRFPEMSEAYNRRLHALAQGAAQQAGFSAQNGVYAGLLGPALETPAEMRFLRTIGADAVGFSTVMETLAAVHAGMQVLGLSTITNMCLPEAPMVASVEEIIAVAQAAAPQMAAILEYVMEHIDEASRVDNYWV